MGGYQAVCEQLLTASNASQVSLIDEKGHEVARAGNAEGFNIEDVVESVTATLAAKSEITSAFHERDRRNVLMALAAPGMVLVVVFDVRSSLGLVRLRVRKAIAELSRTPAGGTSGSGGEGGAAALAQLPKAYDS